MLKALKDLLGSDALFNTITSHSNTPSIQAQEQYEQDAIFAIVVLLLEIAFADDHFDDNEKNAITDILQKRFNINDNDIDDILNQALVRYKNASSKFEFTRVVNEHFSYQQKCELIALMWSLAHSDFNIDSLEEYSIRKIADLLYIKHSDFTYAKQRYAEIIKNLL